MKKINFLVSIIIIAICFTQAYSQSPTINMFPKTPDAAALSKHVDIPPGSYTGVANFTIPLYTINLDGVQIPIELNYTTNGIKVGEIASRVGLGWSLNTGASLSQQVIGFRDVQPRFNFSSWNFNPVPANSCTISGDYAIAMSVTLAINDIDPNSEFPRDLKPDIYSYSLLNGKSGKFIMDRQNQTGIPMPFNLLKIKQPVNDVYNINITDETGIQYAFLDTPYSLISKNTCSDPNFDLEYGAFTDPNYKITKITTTKNNQINYVYGGGNNSFYVSSVSTQKRIKVVVPDGVQTPAPSSPKEKCINYSRSTDGPLKEINFPEGKILFTYNDNTKPRLDVNGDVYLTQIVVKNIHGNIIKNFTLNYDYFYSSGGVPSVDSYTGAYSYSSYLIGSDHRLKLTSVKDNLTNGIYGLEYYETYNGQTLPNRISNDQDFWGVYNGKENGAKSISNSSYAFPTGNTSTYLNADKTPDINYGRLGNLKKIVYPTGGYTEIEYEADEFDLSAPEIIYDYTEESFSEVANNVATPSVEKFITITPNSVNQNLEFTTTYSSPQNENGHCIWQLKKPNNTIETGFAQTTIIRNDPPGNYVLSVTKDLDRPNIKCEATYSWDDLIKTPIETLYTRKAGTIRISKIESVNENGESIKRQYIYKEPTPDRTLPYTKNSGKNLGEELFVPRFIKKIPINSGNNINYGTTAIEYWATNNPGWQTATVRGKPVGYDYVQEYYIDSKNPQNFYRKESKFQNDLVGEAYDPNSVVNKTWPGGGLDRGLLLEEILLDSSNKIVKKIENQYDYDYYFNDRYEPNNTPLGNSMGLGMEIVPVRVNRAMCPNGVPSTYFFEYNIFGLENYWIKNLKTTTTDYGNNQPTLVTEQTSVYSASSLNRHTFPTEQRSEVIGSGVSNSQYFQYALEKGKTMMIERNMVGIPLETTVVKKQNTSDPGKTISKNYTDYPDILPDVQTGNLMLPRSVSSLDLITTGLSTEVTYDKYDLKGNLQQYTTKSGVSTAIIWGYNNTQPIVKIEGVKYSQVSAYIEDIVTASEKDNNPILYNLSADAAEQNLLDKLDEFRKKSELSGFQITTYSYDPLVGVRSITPPSGIRQVYIYDTANRLKEVKDIEGNVLKEYEYHYKP